MICYNWNVTEKFKNLYFRSIYHKTLIIKCQECQVNFLNFFPDSLIDNWPSNLKTDLHVWNFLGQFSRILIFRSICNKNWFQSQIFWLSRQWVSTFVTSHNLWLNFDWNVNFQEFAFLSQFSKINDFLK